MILEIVGSRILAPFLGTSIVVWTSLIGIILGSLSLGYWLGGRLADKGPSYKIFSLFIFISALSLVFIVLFNSTILTFIQEYIAGIYIKTVIASLYLFSLPSVLLGMVSPYAVRLKIKDIANSGQTVGNLYAISTIGSIVGTFAAGFCLIPFFGSRRIFIFLSIVLILTTFLAYSKEFKKTRIIFIFLLSFLLIPASLNRQPGLVDIDTQYNRVLIYKSVDKLTQKPVLNLVTGPYSRQSTKFLDSDDLVFAYTKYYRLARHFKPDLNYSLMIGGAAYSYPKDYLEKYPLAKLDVVEIDAKMTELAKKYFNLQDNPRLTIFHEDGRTFLNKTKTKYDVIYIDAFSTPLTIPYQLTTKEAVGKIYNALVDDGVALVNIISALEGEKGKFLRAELATYKTFFPQVYLFLVQDSKDGFRVQNIMLVGLKSDKTPSFISNDNELNNYLKHLWLGQIRLDQPILTDDYAPVDYYTMKLIS